MAKKKKKTTRPVSKAARIQTVKSNNPAWSNSKIASETGTSNSYVSRLLADSSCSTATATCSTTSSPTGTVTTSSRGATTPTPSRQYAKGAKSASGVCSTETATVLSARAQMTKIVSAVGPKSAQTILDCVTQPCSS